MGVVIKGKKCWKFTEKLVKKVKNVEANNKKALLRHIKGINE